MRPAPLFIQIEYTFRMEYNCSWKFVRFAPFSTIEERLLRASSSDG